MQMSNSEYIKILVPEDREKLDAKPCLPSHVMSLHALRALPIDDQCKHLLKDGKCYSCIYISIFTWLEILFLFHINPIHFSQNNPLPATVNVTSWWRGTVCWQPFENATKSSRSSPGKLDRKIRYLVSSRYIFSNKWCTCRSHVSCSWLCGKLMVT